MLVKILTHISRNIRFWITKPHYIVVAALSFSFAIFLVNAMFFSCLSAKGYIAKVEGGVCYKSKTINSEPISANAIGPYIDTSVHDVILYVPIILTVMVLLVDIRANNGGSKFSLRRLVNTKSLIVFALLYVCGIFFSYNRAEQFGLGTDYHLAWNILGIPGWVILFQSLLYVPFKKMFPKNK